MLELYHNKGYFRDNMLQIILSKTSSYNFLKEIGNHYLKYDLKMKGYQIQDIYSSIFPLLNDDEIYLLKQDYLKRSKIKPKIFFENVISKEERKIVLTLISKKHDIQINKLYKHSVIIKNTFEYFCVYYQDNNHKSFTTNINKTPY